MIFLQDQIEQEIRLVRSCGQEILERLRKIYGSVPQDDLSNIFYMRSRVKSSKSITSKMAGSGYFIENNDLGRSLSTLSDIKDIVGIRLVTLYDDQLTQAIDIILDVIRTGIGQSRPIFNGPTEWNSIEYVNFYSRPHNDIYRQCFEHMSRTIVNKLKGKEKIRALSKLRQPIVRETGYTSMHIICNACSSSGISVPMEIQIRTAAEDLWGEVNHDMLYKVRSPTLWTEKAEENYGLLLEASKTLNNVLANIPPIIANIRSKYKSTETEFLRFKDSGSHKLTFSLVVRYIKLVSMDYDDVIEDCLDTYKTAFNSLSISNSIDDNREIINACLQQIASIVRIVQEKPSVQNATRLQIYRLCEFEALRLEAMSLQLTEGEAIEAEAKNLYHKWQECQHSSGWRLRPLTLIKFFDYFVLEMFDIRRALAALDDAYLVMKTDGALASLSIYRFAIPYILAGHYCSEGEAIMGELIKRGINPVELDSGYNDEIGHHFLRAFRYSIEALEAGSRENGSRGDILLWRGGLNRSLKLNDTARIVFAVRQFFGIAKFRKLCILKLNDVQLILNHADGASPEVIDGIKKLVKELRVEVGNEPRATDN